MGEREQGEDTHACTCHVWKLALPLLSHSLTPPTFLPFFSFSDPYTSPLTPPLLLLLLLSSPPPPLLLSSSSSSPPPFLLPSLRLSGDIQDFKSSFKMAVSQGLRSLTQTLGCVISLYLISPQMTALVGVALPVMIAVGTTFGAVLRQWSRRAQEQASSLCVCVHAY